MLEVVVGLGLIIGILAVCWGTVALAARIPMVFFSVGAIATLIGFGYAVGANVLHNSGPPGWTLPVVVVGICLALLGAAGSADDAMSLDD